MDTRRQDLDFPPLRSWCVSTKGPVFPPRRSLRRVWAQFSRSCLQPQDRGCGARPWAWGVGSGGPA